MIIKVVRAFLVLILSNIIAALEWEELLHQHVLSLVICISIVFSSVLSLRPYLLLLLDWSRVLLVEGLRELLVEGDLWLELIRSVLLCSHG